MSDQLPQSTGDQTDLSNVTKVMYMICHVKCQLFCDYWYGALCGQSIIKLLLQLKVSCKEDITPLSQNVLFYCCFYLFYNYIVSFNM